METTAALPNHQQGWTPEQAWEWLRKTSEESNQRKLEADRRQLKADREMEELKEQIKETDRQMKETARRMAETDRRIGELGNRFGELAEHLVAPSIQEKFNELGFTFEETLAGRIIKDTSGKTIAEVDLILENGDTIMVVEIKAKPLPKDVDAHINRIDILRRRADARNDTRKFRGAVAGAIMLDSVRDYAHEKGFYVIEQTGDTVKITIPEGFMPREW
ncbi:MAG: DUF3782 domain-containing protein [Treponema sp.]|jgi:hypothetical protein|nr:DUF3782 domain-containing protein [Treponema sp.]